MEKIKRMSGHGHITLREQNVARKRIGLAQITVKIRSCRKCDSLFESTNERTCEDCRRVQEKTTVAALQGFEVI